MPLSMDGQPRREHRWLNAFVLRRSGCRSGGAASKRWPTRGAKAKDKIIELRNRGFCGAREASSGPCDHLHWGFGSRAAGSRRVISVVTGKVAEHWPSRPVGASVQV